MTGNSLVLDLTAQLIAINSVNPFQTYEENGRCIGIGNEHRIAVVIEDLLRAAGFNVSRQIVQNSHLINSGPGAGIQVPARWNIVAERGTGPNSILFFGHMDTVDVKPGWSSDPFTATTRKVDGRERLFGLGANDMKSGLAAIISAATRTKVSSHKIKVAFLCDEEFWSLGAVKLVESDFLDDVSIAIAPEVREDPIVPGEQWIGIGRCGRAEFVVEVAGRSCHGADALIHPHAINAAEEGAKLAAQLGIFCRNEQRDFVLSDIRITNSAFINRIEGGRGMLSVPDTATITIDRTFLPDEDTEDFRTRLNAAVIEARIAAGLDPRTIITVYPRPRPTPPCFPYLFPTDTLCISKIACVVKGSCGAIRYGVGRGVADENRLARRGIPTLVIGPDGKDSHCPDEWADLESITRLEDVFTAICHTGLS